MGPDRDILAPQHRLMVVRPSNIVNHSNNESFELKKVSLGSSRDSYTARRHKDDDMKDKSGEKNPKKRKGGKGTTFKMHRTQYVETRLTPSVYVNNASEKDYESNAGATGQKSNKNKDNKSLSSPLHIGSKPILSGKKVKIEKKRDSQSMHQSVDISIGMM